MKSMHKCRSYGQDKLNIDHLILWTSSVMLTFKLPEQLFQMALQLFKENKCDKLFWNPCTNVSYGQDKLNLWPFYHLTFKCDLVLQPFWTNVSNDTATPQGKNCAKLFWNLCINVEVIAPQTSSIYDHFITWLSSMTLTLNLHEQMFQMAMLLLRATTVQNHFETHALIYRLWPIQTFNIPE